MASDIQENGREAIRLEKVSKRHGAAFAIGDVSLSVDAGEILGLVGHTGAGKSSLLRVIAGLDRPESGFIYLDSKFANDIPPHRRGIAFVFQRDVHYPGRSLIRDWQEAERAGVFDRWRALGVSAEEIRTAMKLKDAIYAQAPETLSGGEARRASLLRAILRDQPILLADEPLTGLDLWTRDSVARFLWQFVKATGKTMIVVAHEPVESFGLADRLAVMHQGRLLQCGPADEVRDDPGHRVAVSLLHFPTWNFVGEAQAGATCSELSNFLIERLIAPEKCEITTYVVGGQPSIPVRFLRRRWTPGGWFVEWRHAKTSSVYWSPDRPDLPESAILTWNAADEFWFDASTGCRVR